MSTLGESWPGASFLRFLPTLEEEETRRTLAGERSTRAGLDTPPIWAEFARRVRPRECGSDRKGNWAGTRPGKAGVGTARWAQKDKRVDADCSWRLRLRPCWPPPGWASRGCRARRKAAYGRQPQPQPYTLVKQTVRRRRTGANDRGCLYRTEATVPPVRTAADRDDRWGRPSLVSSTSLCDFGTKPVKAMKERQMCF